MKSNAYSFKSTPYFKNLTCLCVFIFLTFSSIIQAQVGINTTNPDPSSMLDIVAADKGILIPRVSLSNVTDGTLDGTNPASESLLIFNTNASVTGGDGIGYYSYISGVWQKLLTSAGSVSGDADFFEEGTTTAPDDINDDIYTFGNVAIGKNTADYSLDIDFSGSGRTTNINKSGDETTDNYGLYLNNSTTGTGSKYGSYINVDGSGSGFQYGTYTKMEGADNFSTHGAYQDVSATGTGSMYGNYNKVSGANGGNAYGVRNEISAETGRGHYGTFNTITGDAGSNETAGTKTTINVSGNSGFRFGNINNITNNFQGPTYGVSNTLLGISGSRQTGVLNLISNSGNSEHYGVENILEGNGSGHHFGIRNELRGSGNGPIHTGVENFIQSSGTGSKYGTRNRINSSGSGAKYGSYNTILDAGTGNQYGVYSEVPQVSGYAGYFLGRMYFGTNSSNGYIFPSTRGTNGQIIQTDGSGNLSWVDSSTASLTLEDGDGDTKIQVEESADDDTIRFDIEGTEFQNFSKNPYDIFRIQMSSNWGNILIGFNAGVEMRNGATFGQGFDNVGIGWRALESSTIGTGNVALGSRVLEDNITGNINTSIGTRSSWENISGSSNVTIGYGAKWHNLSGNSNVAVGVSADLNNTSGNDNVIIGSGAGGGSTAHSKSGNIFIGKNAGYEVYGDNKLYIENSNSSSPLIYGEFDANILRANGEFQIGDPSTSGFAFPSVDGALNQIMQTNGSGNVSWVEPTSVIPADTDFYEVGTTTSPDAITDNMFTMGNLAIGIDNSDSPLYVYNTTNPTAAKILSFRNEDNDVAGLVVNTGNYESGISTEVVGIEVDANSITTGDVIAIKTEPSLGLGDKYGLKQLVRTSDPSGTQNMYGTFSDVRPAGTGSGYGSYNFLAASAHSTLYGTYNEVISEVSSNGDSYGSYNTITALDSNGDKYGVYSKIEATTNSQYAVYAENLNTSFERYAGYFRGKVSFGTTAADNYIFPLSRGTNNQIMQTDGSGNVSWVTPSFATAANNGLSLSGTDVVLGGSLNQNTTINNGNLDFTHNLNGTGDFKIQEDGTNKLEVRDNGNTYLGGDTHWNANTTSGTQVARLFNSANAGFFQLFNGGTSQHLFQTTSTSIINEQGLGIDFRIEGDTQQNLFFVDGSTDRIGIRENTPDFDVHINQSSNSQNGAGGFGLQSNGSTNTWKVYHSGAHISFSENGVRRAYITAGTGAYMPTSDRRLKKSISEVESILDKVNSLKAYRYLYKDQDLSAKKTIGFMAQDVEPFFPELVEKAEDGYYGLNYAGFGIIAVKAIQEQQTEIDLLKTENTKLQEKLKDQEVRLQRLEALISKITN